MNAGTAAVVCWCRSNRGQQGGTCWGGVPVVQGRENLNHEAEASSAHPSNAVGAWGFISFRMLVFAPQTPNLTPGPSPQWCRPSGEPSP
jgi:hypothetical protein